jgi:hypothetical protein
MEGLEINIKLEAGGETPYDMATAKTILKKAIENDWNWNIAEDGSWTFDATGQVEEMVEAYEWQKGICNDSERAWKLDKNDNVVVDKEYCEHITEKKYVEATDANKNWATRLHSLTIRMVAKCREKIKSA